MKRDNHNRIPITRLRLAGYHQGGAGLSATIRLHTTCICINWYVQALFVVPAMKKSLSA
jgi:hypothetical protein